MSHKWQAGVGWLSLSLSCRAVRHDVPRQLSALRCDVTVETALSDECAVRVCAVRGQTSARSDEWRVVSHVLR